jgi:hypothetical protein
MVNAKAESVLRHLTDAPPAAVAALPRTRKQIADALCDAFGRYHHAADVLFDALETVQVRALAYDNITPDIFVQWLEAASGTKLTADERARLPRMTIGAAVTMLTTRDEQPTPCCKAGCSAPSDKTIAGKCYCADHQPTEEDMAVLAQGRNH